MATIRQRERMLHNLDMKNLLPSDPLMVPWHDAEESVRVDQERGEDPEGNLEVLNSLEREPVLPWDLDQW